MGTSVSVSEPVDVSRCQAVVINDGALKKQRPVERPGKAKAINTRVSFIETEHRNPKEAQVWMTHRDFLKNLMPDLCGLIPPLAMMIAEYSQGVKKAKFPDFPEEYKDNGDNMFTACIYNDIYQLRYLVEKQSASITSDHPITDAARYGRIDCVMYLLSKGAPYFNLQKDDKPSALFFAAESGQMNVAEYLLAFYNEVPAEDDQTVPTRVCDQRDTRGYTVLHAAAASGCVQLVRLLIVEYGMDPMDCRNCFRDTPLNGAVGQGHYNVVECLVEEFGVDVNHRDDCGRRALGFAEERGFPYIMDYLKAHGAKL